MSYYVKNDDLISENGDIKYHNTKKTSGKMQKPKFLVLHYTAGRSFDADVNTLSTSNVEASCHLVIGQQGEVAQIGKLNDVLWHAGKSAWKGYTNLNQHSIGIEVCSPGLVELVSSHPELDKYTVKTWWGETKTYQKKDLVLAPHKNDASKTPRWWVAFTPEQNMRIIEIGSALVSHYGLEVVGHDFISPGRKTDPGPCMPSNIYDILNGRQAKPVEYNTSANNGRSAEKIFVVSGTGNEGLNVRSSPNGRIITVLPEGSSVKVEQRNSDGWWFVDAGTISGFVYKNWLKEI